MHPAIIKQLHNEVFESLFEILASETWPDLLSQAQQWQRKRCKNLHSQTVDVFPLLSALSVGGDYSQAKPICLAWVLFLMAGRSLDDVFDNHVITDKAKGSLSMGLSAIGLANMCIADAALDPSILKDVTTRFNYGLAMAARAESYESLQQDLKSTIRVMGEQTGVPFAVAAWSGARIVDDFPTIYEFGFNAGLALQIFDNLQDIEKDAMRGVVPFPVSLVGDGRLLKDVVGLVNSRDGSAVKQMLVDEGVYQQGQQLAMYYRIKAMKLLENETNIEKEYLLYLLDGENNAASQNT